MPTRKIMPPTIAQTIIIVVLSPPSSSGTCGVVGWYCLGPGEEIRRLGHVLLIVELNKLISIKL